MIFKMDPNENESHRGWLGGKLAEKCARNLEKHGFDVRLASGIEQAKAMILEMISDYDTFGFGGSGTTRALGLPDALREMGKTVHDHWKDLSREEDMAVRLDQGRCQCFLCSANAVSLTGEIVNVDAVGNRNCAMTFGPEKVVIVAGVNKIAPDLDSAIKRIREVAAPMRAKSLGRETPCAETGICADCNSPQRICNITTILHRKPMFTDLSIILVNQHLGF